MNKQILRALIGISILANMSSANEYLNPKNPYLNKKEKHSLALAKQWLNKDIKSYRGKNGRVNFIYGTTMPSIITAPLRISDIELQAGEIVKDIQIGDTTRWIISLSTSGPTNNLISHVIIKPTDVNLKTTIAIFTDRRTYHLNLVSRKRDYMPIVGFDYVGDINNALNKYKNAISQKNENSKFNVYDKKITKIDNLDFDYSIEGISEWKPVRVYNDGIKTYIQMPKEMQFKEAPILMVLDNADKNQIVNYRLKNDKFIVDKLFNKAVLMLGVGSDQQIVKIEKNNLKTPKEKKDPLEILNPKRED